MSCNLPSQSTGRRFQSTAPRYRGSGTLQCLAILELSAPPASQIRAIASIRSLSASCKTPAATAWGAHFRSPTSTEIGGPLPSTRLLQRAVRFWQRSTVCVCPSTSLSSVCALFMVTDHTSPVYMTPLSPSTRTNLTHNIMRVHVHVCVCVHECHHV